MKYLKAPLDAKAEQRKEQNVELKNEEVGQDEGLT